MRYLCPKCGNPLMKGARTAAGKIRWTCCKRSGIPGSGVPGQGTKSVYCYSTTLPQPGVVRKQDGSTKRSAKTPIFKRALGGVTTILVTAAQNATPSHPGFVKSLETHANFVSAADILCIPYRYKNPTSRWESSQHNAEEWSPELNKYLCNQRKQLNANLLLMGNVKVQATSGNPLGGKNALSHAQSAIFGHPKLQLTTVPTPQGRYPKIMTTTGACTVENYTDTAQGAIGEFHHTLGATLVEIKGKRFHLRQINADKKTGEYIDLREHYTPEGVTKRAPRAAGLILGDWHKDFTLPAVEHATFGPGGMVELLQPKVIAWHDLADFYSVNPHHRGNFLITNSKIENGRMDARAELERACQYVVDHTPSDSISIIVPSNHNDFLSRWIIDTDPRTTMGPNLKLWCESVLAMRERTRLTKRGTEYPDAFVYWAKRFFEKQKNIIVLERGDSYMIKDIEAGLHFDKGPNGARGSRKNLCRMGVKTIGGHGHGPGIEEGATQVGTGTGELEYGIGSPSGWLNTHGEINAFGKRCLHTIIGESGEWHL